MTENEISKIVVDAAVKLHQDLGPGLLESVYEVALACLLMKRGFPPWELRFFGKVYGTTVLPFHPSRLRIFSRKGAKAQSFSESKNSKSFGKPAYWFPRMTDVPHNCQCYLSSTAFIGGLDR